MRDSAPRWQIVVPAGGDALRQERLTRDLYDTLRATDDLTVGFADGNKPAEPGHKGADDEDALLKRLYQVLSRQTAATLTLGESVHGHPADALVQGVDGTAPRAVLHDRGPEEDADEARHLRLMPHRRNLLSSGEDRDNATRWPAWRLYDTSKD